MQTRGKARAERTLSKFLPYVRCISAFTIPKMCQQKATKTPKKSKATTENDNNKEHWKIAYSKRKNRTDQTLAHTMCVRVNRAHDCR